MGVKRARRNWTARVNFAPGPCRENFPVPGAQYFGNHGAPFVPEEMVVTHIRNINHKQLVLSAPRAVNAGAWYYNLPPRFYIFFSTSFSFPPPPPHPFSSKHLVDMHEKPPLAQEIISISRRERKSYLRRPLATGGISYSCW